ncbi:hypothetical protein RHGRI_014445 [Rhododendron griersonianum]|uniref:Uncharacterized protein n=1 Tax=Rhododendron griersonianum TaxID=479676 RepID=A0AAV6K9E0_9ERIC|nr:hypothetical protein RHGRI_014445 [Rhododendron griersonianum]
MKVQRSNLSPSLLKSHTVAPRPTKNPYVQTKPSLRVVGLQRSGDEEDEDSLDVLPSLGYSFGHYLDCSAHNPVSRAFGISYYYCIQISLPLDNLAVGLSLTPVESGRGALSHSGRIWPRTGLLLSFYYSGARLHHLGLGYYAKIYAKHNYGLFVSCKEFTSVIRPHLGSTPPSSKR